MPSVTSYREMQTGINVKFHFEDGAQLVLVPSWQNTLKGLKLTGLETAILYQDGTAQAAAFDGTDINERGYVTRGPTQTQFAEYLAAIIQTQEPQLREIYKKNDGQHFPVLNGIKNKKNLLEMEQIPKAKKLPQYLCELADCLNQ